jgi:DNA-binding beta-propeller fold protein YncE
MNLRITRHVGFAVVLLSIFGFVAACDSPSENAQGGANQASQEGANQAAQGGKQAPIFEVDPFWPKPLPNHWVTGSTIGLSVDAQDNVWSIHRGQAVEANFKAADIKAADAVDDEVQPSAGAVTAADPIGRCCKVAPPVLVYDAAGNLVKSWGGPGEGYEWPDSNHGITVDNNGNVWIAGNGPKDTQVLKFANDGKFLLQIGKKGVHNGSNDTANLWQPTKIWHDKAANEVYISDGYGNRRVIVFDADTGAYKRHWGAYGAKPDDLKLPPYNPSAPPSKQFSTVHCVIVSDDGFVYVCDRVNDRIQVFRKDGTFVKEALIDPKTYRSGSVWDMTFSRDPQQTYLYAANGVDEKVNILNRETLEVLTTFGDGGRHPGQFFGVHNLATDSKGNLYTAETYTGARVQRFLYKGVGAVTKFDQGPPWPQSR